MASSLRARVLIAGSGRMGQIRARLVRSNPRFELAGIIDSNLSNAERLAHQFNAPAFNSLEHAVDTTQADALIVSTPTFTHESIIRQAADNSMPVFTEKPVDETADKIERLFAYTNEKQTALCCSFQRRFDPSYVSCANAVRQGDIGTPISASIFFADHPCPPREFLLTGGNIFMDLSAHDVDYIMDTLQDEVVSVYAVGTSSDAELHDANVHDNATMVMNFAKGTTVTLFMSRSAVYGYDQRCEIFGTQGHVAVQNIHETSARLSNATGVHSSRLQHSFPQRFNDGFGLELDAFASVVIDGASWPVTKEQCINVQRVADAAKKSAETGIVVPINEMHKSTTNDDDDASAVVG